VEIAAMEVLLAAKKVLPLSCAQNDNDLRLACCTSFTEPVWVCRTIFSVIGFDNIHIAEVTIPPLTTVEMSRLDLARAAVTALRQQVESVGDSTKKR